MKDKELIIREKVQAILNLIEDGDNLDEVISIATPECKSAILFPDTYITTTTGKKLSFLHYAVARGRLKITNWLLSLYKDNGQDAIDLQIESGITPVNLAADQEKWDLVEFLLDQGADPNKIFNDSTVLSEAIVNQQPRIIERLIKCRARLPLTRKGYNHTPLFYAAYNNETEEYKRLKQEYIKKAIVYPEDHPIEYYFAALKMWDYFDDIVGFKAEPVPDSTKLSTDVFMETKFGNKFADYKKNRNSRLKELFKEQDSIELSSDLLEVFSDIFVLLNDIDLCCDLLEDLDQKIALVQEFCGIEFEEYCPEDQAEHYKIHHFYFPKSPQSQLPKTKFKILDRILLQLENEFGINLPDPSKPELDPVVVFSGYVNPDKAKKIVSSGKLFTEDSSIGNPIFHGKYSHRLQWFIILSAIKKGIIDLKNHTPKDLLVAALQNNGQIWNRLVDNLHYVYTDDDDPLSVVVAGYKGGVPCQFSFINPQAFNSYMLFSENPKIQHLRGYLTCSFWSGIKKIKQQVGDDYTELNLLKLVVASQVQFGFPKRTLELERRLQDHPNDLQKSDGVVTKSKSSINRRAFFKSAVEKDLHTSVNESKAYSEENMQKGLTS